jgi:S-adenosylmethionine-diacylglycerol 3-amino-3-carboxypropyl transferase
VISVDSNTTQNDLVELKVAAIGGCSRADTLGFLGAQNMSAVQRVGHYRALRDNLGDGARAYWDQHIKAIERGVLSSGSAERFSEWITRLIRIGVHPKRRIERMLHSASLEEQKELFHREWDSRRWRALFPVLFNRFAFRGQFWSPDVRKGSGATEIAKHFRRLFEHTLTELPVRNNYFLHHMFLGSYPVDEPDGVPPFLREEEMKALALARGRLTLVDASFTDCLRKCPDASIDGFLLSNICEWLPPTELEPLFAEIARTAKPGGRVCFRNFLGWTDVPEKWRDVFEIDSKSETLIARDRSAQQRRFVACDIHLP